jgi:hypothetical protein
MHIGKRRDQRNVLDCADAYCLHHRTSLFLVELKRSESDMKKAFTILAAALTILLSSSFVSSSASAQTVTPNLGLTLPYQTQPNWGVIVNNDLTLIDTFAGSSGGANVPAYSLYGNFTGASAHPTFSTSPLPVNMGGTGTNAPGLIAGSNVTITGVWPNQTINSTGGGGGGGGTVTAFSSTSSFPGLSVSVATPTTTPDLTISPTSGLTANQFLATPNGSAGALALRSIVGNDFSGLTGCTTTGFVLSPAGNDCVAAGSGTVTHTLGNLPAGDVIVGNGGGDVADSTYKLNASNAPSPANYGVALTPSNNTGGASPGNVIGFTDVNGDLQGYKSTYGGALVSGSVSVLAGSNLGPAVTDYPGVGILPTAGDSFAYYEAFNPTEFLGTCYTFEQMGGPTASTLDQRWNRCMWLNGVSGNVATSGSGPSTVTYNFGSFITGWIVGDAITVNNISTTITGGTINSITVAANLGTNASVAWSSPTLVPNHIVSLSNEPTTTTITSQLQGGDYNGNAVEVELPRYCNIQAAAGTWNGQSNGGSMLFVYPDFRIKTEGFNGKGCTFELESATVGQNIFTMLNESSVGASTSYMMSSGVTLYNPAAYTTSGYNCYQCQGADMTTHEVISTEQYFGESFTYTASGTAVTFTQSGSYVPAAGTLIALATTATGNPLAPFVIASSPAPTSSTFTVTSATSIASGNANTGNLPTLTLATSGSGYLAQAGILFGGCCNSIFRAMYGDSDTTGGIDFVSNGNGGGPVGIDSITANHTAAGFPVFWQSGGTTLDNYGTCYLELNGNNANPTPAVVISSGNAQFGACVASATAGSNQPPVTSPVFYYSASSGGNLTSLSWEHGTIAPGWCAFVDLTQPSGPLQCTNTNQGGGLANITVGSGIYYVGVLQAKEVDSGNFRASLQGTAVASATTISPSNGTNYVTGSTAITTIGTTNLPQYCTAQYMDVYTNGIYVTYASAISPSTSTSIFAWGGGSRANIAGTGNYFLAGPFVNVTGSAGVTNGSATVTYVSGASYALMIANQVVLLGGSPYIIQSISGTTTGATITLTTNYTGTTGTVSLLGTWAPLQSSAGVQNNVAMSTAQFPQPDCEVDLAPATGATLTLNTGGNISEAVSGVTGEFLRLKYDPMATTNLCTVPTAGVTGCALPFQTSSTSAGVTSITNSDGTLSFSPTTGAAVGSLALSHPNTWTGLQTFGTEISIGGVTAAGATGTGNVAFSASPTFTGTVTMAGITASGTPTFTGIEGGGTYCVQVSSSGVLSNTGSACGSGGGSPALSSVTAATANATIANGNFTETWTSALTTASVAAFTLKEASAATGTGDEELAVTTLAGSTSIPLAITDSLTGTQTLAALQVTPTWNTTGVVDAGILENVTNTASGTGSLLIDLQIGSTSQFKVDKSGNVTTLGSVATGSSAPTACGSATGCWAAAEASTAGTPTTGDDYIRASASTHQYLVSLNNGAEFVSLMNYATAPIAAGGTNATSAAAGTVPNATSSSASSWTATPTLGASGTLGSITFGNATSGTVTLEPVTGALGTVTASLPANTGTLAELNLAQTFSAVQTISASNGLVLSAMTGTACLEEVSGVVTSTGSACGSGGGISFPQTVSGTTTSGGIPYFSSTTTLTSSALLASGAIVTGGGAGGAPATDSSATLSTGTLSLGASGTLGAIVLGNATSGTLTIEPATGAITSYTVQLPVAQPSGSNIYLSCTAANPAVCTWAAGGSGGGTGTTGQNAYFSATNTLSGSSSIFVTGSTASSNVGIDQIAPIQQLELSGPFQHDVPSTGTVTLGATCSATATSCTLSGGTALNAGGGVVLIGFANGNNNQEYICYSAATSTTLTIGGGNCQTPVTTNGRSYWGSTAASHNGGDQVVQVEDVIVASDTATPDYIMFGNYAAGAFAFTAPATLFGGTVYGAGAGTFNAGLYFVNNPAFCLSANPTGSSGFCVTLNNNEFRFTNTAGNTSLAGTGNTLDYSIATQTIATTATLTALTNVTTPVLAANGTTAAASSGGVLSSRCHVIWSQATGGTVSFAVHLSAAVTRLDVTEVDYDGAAGIAGSSFVQQGVTASGTGTAIGTVTPSAFGTVYFSDFNLTMNPGTTNSPSVQLYAESSSSSDTLSVYAGSGCSTWQ